MQSGPFQFRSNVFRKNARVQVFQGEAVLYQQSFRNLIVNEIMQLNGDWVSKVDPRGEALRIKVL